MEQQSVGTITCARCHEGIQPREHFAHYRWSGTGGLIEIAFHERCHTEMSDEEFSGVVDTTIEALLSEEPELFESEVSLYDEGESQPGLEDVIDKRG